MMEAIVEFGSQISGGTTKYSDKDLLIISMPQKKRMLQNKYTDKGYSVSFYSPSQLEHMRLKGALFLQHLKLESNVIYDNEEEFKNFIGRCDPIAPDPKELERCKRSIQEAILSPNSKLLSGWASDYLYVLSRDYFVKYFASKGRYVFNANLLCEEIKNEFDLPNRDVSSFLGLRNKKSIYRNKIPQLTQDDASLVEWKYIMGDLLNIGIGSECYSEIAYLNKIYSVKFESTYDLLRYVESLRIIFPEISCGIERDSLIQKMIVSPNNYCATSSSGKNTLLSYAILFVSLANKALQGTSGQRGFSESSLAIKFTN